MEPKALANLNGMLVSTPCRGPSNAGPSRECLTVPNTPANRRDSGLWVRTPEDTSSEAHDYAGAGADYDPEWDSFLTPVPKTPAPEAIARYAANVAPETPSAQTEYGGNETLVTRTCPPKEHQYCDLGQGVLSSEKDERVMRRLMEARRKSLQFAPRIGSPLSRAW